MRISDWSSDVCSSDLSSRAHHEIAREPRRYPYFRTSSQRAKLTPPVMRNGTSTTLSETLASTCPIIRLVMSNRSEEHTSELQSLMRISYAVFCLKKKKTDNMNTIYILHT